MIQIAQLTWRHAHRSSVVRAILFLTLAGTLVGLGPGIFDDPQSADRSVDRVWGSILLGAVAIAAYVPALRWDQLRAARAQDVSVLAARFSLTWPLGTWGGSAGIALSVVGAGVVTLTLFADLSASGPELWPRVTSAMAAIAVTSSLALLVATLVSRSTTLLIVSACWLIAASISTYGIPAQGSLPIANAVLIILPPIHALSICLVPPQSTAGTPSYWECLALAATISSACLAFTIGITRFRWN